MLKQETNQSFPFSPFSLFFLSPSQLFSTKFWNKERSETRDCHFLILHHQKLFPLSKIETYSRMLKLDLFKLTIGEMLAKAINCTFIDADDFHSKENKEKMSKGTPLSEEDRIPWLETLQDAIRGSIVDGETVILGCSALQKKYREILRMADPDYSTTLDDHNHNLDIKLGSKASSCRVKFVFLQAPAEVIADRLNRRAEEGKHFMPATLLRSQLDLLQLDNAEGIITVNACLSPEAIVASIPELVF